MRVSLINVDSGYPWSSKGNPHAAIVASGCAKEAPVSPVASVKTALFRDANDGDGLPDLSACPQLAAPQGSTLVIPTIARGSAVEVETQMAVAVALSFTNANKIAPLLAKLDRLSKMLFSLYRSLGARHWS